MAKKKSAIQSAKEYYDRVAGNIGQATRGIGNYLQPRVVSPLASSGYNPIQTWKDNRAKTRTAINAVYGATFKPFVNQVGGAATSLGLAGLNAARPYIPQPLQPQAARLGTGLTNLGQRQLKSAGINPNTRPADPREYLKFAATTGGNTARAMASAAGIAALPTTAGLLSTGLATGLGTYGRVKQGQQGPEALGSSFGSGLKLSGITKFTNPAIGRFTGRYAAPVNTFLGRQLVTRGLTGVGNTIEDEIIARLDSYRPGLGDRALSFGIGALVGGNDEIIERFFKKQGLPAKQAKDAARYIKNKRTSLFEGSTKRTPQFASDLGEEGPRGLSLTQTKPNQYKVDRRYGNRFASTLQSAPGAVAGVETYQDEDGNWKVRYSPATGLVGFAGLAGASKIGEKIFGRAPSSKPRSAGATPPVVKNIGLLETAKTGKLEAGSQIPTAKASDMDPLGQSISQETKSYLNELAGKQKAATGGNVPIKSRAGSFLRDIKKKIVDATAPIEDTLGEAEKKFKYNVRPQDDIRPQIDRVLRAKTIAGQFAKDNGLVDIIQKVDDVDALDQYLIAKQATRVTEFGKETGRDLTRDAQLVKELGAKYEPLAKQATAYNQKLLDYATETGLVSKKLATDLKQKYPDYVPLNRIFAEDEILNSSYGGSRSVASLSRQTAVQKLEGSRREIQSPLASMLAKTQTAFEQGEKNRAAKMLANYRNLPGLNELIKEGKGIHTFSYLEDGVKKTFSTTPEIASAAKSLDVQQLGLLEKVLRVPTRALQMGAVGLNLPFVATNVMKDQVVGAINSNKVARTSILNPLNFVRALFSAAKHDDLYEDMVRQGAGGTSFDIARSQPTQTLVKIRADKNLTSNIKYKVTHPGELFRAVEDLIGRGEEVTRIQQFKGTYDALIKEGRTPQDAKILAAQAARNNTANFLRKGEWGKVLNSVIPFFNAGIQGARVLMRNMKERPVATGAKLAVGLFMPVAYATTWNLSDPKRKEIYEDIQDHEKENNIIIIPNGAQKDEKGRYNIIKIPLPPGLSNLTALVRRPLEQANGLDPVRFGEIAGNLFTTATSVDITSPRKLVSSLTPQALKAPLETMTNQNLFTGKEIVPSYMKNLQPQDQVKPYTGVTARVVGKALNTSPLKVENFVKTSLAGVGSQMLNASDRVLAGITGAPPEQISGETAVENLQRRFGKAYGGETMDKAYEQKDKQDSLKKEALRLLSVGDKEASRRLAVENKINITVGDYKKYQKSLSKKAADAYVKRSKDEAKRMVQEQGITLTRGEVKAAAKRYAIELYKLGMIEDSKQIANEYGLVITKKDVE